MLRPVAVLALAALTLVGCGKGGDASTGARQKVIGVSLRTRGGDFYKELEAGLAAAAERQGYRLVVQSAEGDAAAQTRQLDEFAKQRVDAIVLVPCDPDTVAAGLRGVAAAKIPVFTADIAAKGADVVSHVASDNYLGGKLAGRTMSKLLGGRGKVIVIDHPGVSSVDDRVRGFEDALKPQSGISIVAKPSSDGERDKAESVMDVALRRYDDLAGVFAVDDDSALGALRAIESAKRDRVVVIGFDATPEAQDAIRRGSAMKADVAQFPKRIGEKTIDAVTTHFAGEKLDKTTPVNVGIVDAESLSKPK